MSVVCHICSHPNREAIDKALLANTPRQRVADEYGLHLSSVQRHTVNHLHGALTPRQVKLWERRPGERPRQWNAFEAYLKLCTENQDRDVSFAELARSLGRNPETVRAWAFRYRWKERVEAWQSEIARARLKRLRAEAERSRERWRHTGRTMQGIGSRRLAKINPDELGPEEARRYVMDGAALEHRGFGAVIDRTSDRGQSQLNVQINIDGEHARRVIELYQSRRQLESGAITVEPESEEREF